MASAGRNECALERPRSALRRIRHCWGLTPGIQADARPVTLGTRDGLAIAASYLPGPAVERPPADVAGVVLAPGFAGHRTKPAYALLAERLARHAAVLSLDLRGHGGSEGRCTLGVDEVHEVGAAAAWLRRSGHGFVAVIGASMGATAVLRAAGSRPRGRFDAVCAISAPATWGPAPTPAAARLARVTTSACNRRVIGLVTHVRIARGVRMPEPVTGILPRWLGPPAPLDLVAAVAPVPLLLVHGIDDAFVPAQDARMLASAAGDPCTLWLRPPGFGHAEDGFRPDFADRLASAVVDVRRTGRWPPDDGSIADAGGQPLGSHPEDGQGPRGCGDRRA